MKQRQRQQNNPKMKPQCKAQVTSLNHSNAIKTKSKIRDRRNSTTISKNDKTSINPINCTYYEQSSPDRSSIGESVHIPSKPANLDKYQRQSSVGTVDYDYSAMISIIKEEIAEERGEMPRVAIPENDIFSSDGITDIDGLSESEPTDIDTESDTDRDGRHYNHCRQWSATSNSTVISLAESVEVDVNDSDQDTKNNDEQQAIPVFEKGESVFIQDADELNISEISTNKQVDTCRTPKNSRCKKSTAAHSTVLSGTTHIGHTEYTNEEIIGDTIGAIYTPDYMSSHGHNEHHGHGVGVYDDRCIIDEGEESMLSDDIITDEEEIGETSQDDVDILSDECLSIYGDGEDLLCGKIGAIYTDDVIKSRPKNNDDEKEEEVCKLNVGITDERMFNLSRSSCDEEEEDDGEEDRFEPLECSDDSKDCKYSTSSSSKLLATPSNINPINFPNQDIIGDTIGAIYTPDFKANKNKSNTATETTFDNDDSKLIDNGFFDDEYYYGSSGDCFFSDEFDEYDEYDEQQDEDESESYESYESQKRDQFSEQKQQEISDTDSGDGAEMYEIPENRTLIDRLLERFGLGFRWKQYFEELGVKFVDEILNVLPSKITQPDDCKNMYALMRLNKLAKYVANITVNNNWYGLKRKEWTELQTNRIGSTFQHTSDLVYNHANYQSLSDDMYNIDEYTMVELHDFDRTDIGYINLETLALNTIYNLVVYQIIFQHIPKLSSFNIGVQIGKQCIYFNERFQIWKNQKYHAQITYNQFIENGSKMLMNFKKVLSKSQHIQYLNIELLHQPRNKSDVQMKVGKSVKIRIKKRKVAILFIEQSRCTGK